MDARVRPLDPTFAPQILEILNDAILHSTSLYEYRPRSIETMEAWFHIKEKGRYPVLGIVDPGGHLLGFGTYGSFRERPAYKYTIEHSVYVEKESRGRGLGGIILRELIDAAMGQGYHCMIGGIDSENEASMRLHRRFGFEECGRIRHAAFKFGRWLDLTFYQLLLPTPADPLEE